MQLLAVKVRFCVESSKTPATGEDDVIASQYLRADMYKILRIILFFFPAEGVHHVSMKALKVLCGWGWGQWLITRACQPEEDAKAADLRSASLEGSPHRIARGLERTVFGLLFRNAVGLGAGF